MRIDHATAEQLRTMISELQRQVYLDPTIEPVTAERLVYAMSDRGFGLIDRLEGVVR